jgi:hypothetical protein
LTVPIVYHLYFKINPDHDLRIEVSKKIIITIDD